MPYDLHASAAAGRPRRLCIVLLGRLHAHLASDGAPRLSRCRHANPACTVEGCSKDCVARSLPALQSSHHASGCSLPTQHSASCWRPSLPSPTMQHRCISCHHGCLHARAHRGAHISGLSCAPDCGKIAAAPVHAVPWCRGQVTMLCSAGHTHWWHSRSTLSSCR